MFPHLPLYRAMAKTSSSARGGEAAFQDSPFTREQRATASPIQSPQKIPEKHLISCEEFSKLLEKNGYGFFASVRYREFERLKVLLGVYERIAQTSLQLPANRLNVVGALHELEITCLQAIKRMELRLENESLYLSPLARILVGLYFEVKNLLTDWLMIVAEGQESLWIPEYGTLERYDDIRQKFPEWQYLQDFWLQFLKGNTALQIAESCYSGGRRSEVTDWPRGGQRVKTVDEPEHPWKQNPEPVEFFGERMRLVEKELLSFSFSKNSSEEETGFFSSEAEEELRAQSMAGIDKSTGAEKQEAAVPTGKDSFKNFQHYVMAMVGRLLMFGQGRDLFFKVPLTGPVASRFPEVHIYPILSSEGGENELRIFVHLPEGTESPALLGNISSQEIDLGKGREEAVDISLNRELPDLSEPIRLGISPEVFKEKTCFFTTKDWSSVNHSGYVFPMMDFLLMGLELHCVLKGRERTHMRDAQLVRSLSEWMNPFLKKAGLPSVTSFTFIPCKIPGWKK
ncbi:MAG: hypothetical protein MI784_09485 [Cytophagales bacterium]|nr:hypothetical protein [Cytophagales bacterium]